MTRPVDFDPTTPAGTSSPRDGDNQMRQIKLWTQNGYNDLVATDRSAVGRQTHPLFMSTMSATGNATIGGTVAVTGTSTFTGALTASGGVVGNLTGNVTGNVNGTVGATTPSTGAFTTVTTSGTATVGTTAAGGTVIIGDYTFTVSTEGHVTISSGGTNLFRVLDSGAVLAAGNVTAFADIS